MEGWQAWTPSYPEATSEVPEIYNAMEEYPHEVSDEEVAVALNCMEECDLFYPEAAGEAIQLQHAANVAMGKAGGKGKFGKGKKGFPVVKSNLSMRLGRSDCRRSRAVQSA